MKKLNDWMYRAIKHMFAGKVFAFVAVLSQAVEGGAFGLGVAVANEPGYSPIPLNECHGDNYEEMLAYAETLNDKLGLNEKAAGWIIASTMVEWDKIRSKKR